MTQLHTRLRQKYPRFFYHRYSVAQEDKSLIFSFHLEIEPDIHFFPRVIVKGNLDYHILSRLDKEILNNIAFHLGLMEIPSYWKAVCSPEIFIMAGRLDDYQISWWKKLFLNGLGEFFYINDIDFTPPDFITFRINGGNLLETRPYEGQLNSDRLLIPLTGGKDSAVTYELLKESNKDITCMCLNPTFGALEKLRINQDKAAIIVERNIDETLLSLNKKGYLNGHTPFSAYLAFLSASCAILFDFKGIALSNERSSNEGNISLYGVEINHQYSKSFDFEKRFRDYSTRYLARDVEYFSLLRPFYELQIAAIFSRFSKYFPIFRSCNRGERTNSWCHRCPKCLFVFTILYPFIPDQALTTSIFSKNLFDDQGLVGQAFNLLGDENCKPFECVGTKEETLAAFYLCIKKARRQGWPLPIVLQSVDEKILSLQQDMEERTAAILGSWNNQHAIPADIKKSLKSSLNAKGFLF